MMINGNNNSGALSDDASSGGGGGAGSGGGALKKGPWTAAEDAILREYVKKHGEGNWNAVQKNSGLSRCGKSCRLRWANHLRPNLKKGSFTPDEERIILELHAKLGNKWARMAAQLPGRTDNEIKNYWNTRVKRRQRQGLPLYPHDLQKQPSSFHHHQPFLSQSSMKPTNLSSMSSSQEQKLNFGSLLPPFNPMNISNTTPSFPPHQNNTHFSSSSINSLKRFRPNSCGLYQPFSPYLSQTLPHSSSILNQSLLPPPQPIQFHLGNYDPNQSQHILQNQYEHRNMIPMSSSPSIKLELPSNQLPQSDGITSRQDVDYKINGTFTRSNGGGYLDDILQEAQQARDDDEELRRKGLFTQQEEQCRVDGIEREAPKTRKIFNENNDTARLESAGHWNDSRTTHSTIGVKRKEAGDNQNDSVVQEDDLSRLLDSIPSTMLVSEFYNDGGDQISNGQSSGVTDDETGLDMQHHLPSSLSTTTTTATNTNTTTTSGGSTIPQHDWNVMGTGWNDLPEMC